MLRNEWENPVDATNDYRGMCLRQSEQIVSCVVGEQRLPECHEDANMEVTAKSERQA